MCWAAAPSVTSGSPWPRNSVSLSYFSYLQNDNSLSPVQSQWELEIMRVWQTRTPSGCPSLPTSQKLVLFRFSGSPLLQEKQRPFPGPQGWVLICPSQLQRRHSSQFINKCVTSFWLRGHMGKSLGEFGVSLILKRTIRKGLSFTGLWVLLDDNVILGSAAAML